MATYYVDPGAGSDARSGTSESEAWLTEANVNTTGAGSHTFNLKRGTTLTLTATITVKANWTFDAYGSGAIPIIYATGVNHFTIAVQNVTLSNLFLSGPFDSTGSNILFCSSNIGGLTITDCTFSGGDVHYDCAAGTSGAVSATRCYFTRCWFDSWSPLGSTVSTLRWCRWYRIGVDHDGTGAPGSPNEFAGAGDPISMHDTATFVCEDSTFEDNQRGVGLNVNTSGTNYLRRCFIVTTSNTTSTGSWVFAQDAAGTTQIENCIFILTGTTVQIAIGVNSGLVNAYYCTIINVNTNAGTTALYGAGTGILTAKNCISVIGTGGAGIHVYDGTETTPIVGPWPAYSDNSRNNCFYPDGAAKFGILFNSSPTFGNFAAWSGAPFSKDTVGSIITDPKLLNTVTPTLNTAATLKAGSSAIGAAVDIGITTDYRNRTRVTFDMGAMMYVVGGAGGIGGASRMMGVF